MILDVLHENAPTEVGSYFVANYPPFSVWSAEHVPVALEALSRSASVAPKGDATSLGLYLHIPFCRKRCRFCYFRVYTDKNSDDVEVYLDALAHEVALYAGKNAIRDRNLEFVYFGGGTPSFLSSEQLQRLVDRISDCWSWQEAREVTFECEPGTLKKGKLETIKAIGTTRLSLGIEHFDDEILEINGRAHKSPEVYRAYQWAREVGFPQINIDLIAGMVGDTDDKWKWAVDEAIKLDPDSVTIYQMELPHNTVIAREAATAGGAPVASWATKRAWVALAFARFEQAGYVVSSAYTLRKPGHDSGFVYRDSVWHGADMIGTGVASFSHFDGIHFQNVDGWDDYMECLSRDELPLARAFPMTRRQRLIREFILQMKLGRVSAANFLRKFGIDITVEFREALESLVGEEFARLTRDGIELTRAGLLRIDALLPRFFEPVYRDIRYT